MVVGESVPPLPIGGETARERSCDEFIRHLRGVLVFLLVRNDGEQSIAEGRDGPTSHESAGSQRRDGAVEFLIPSAARCSAISASRFAAAGAEVVSRRRERASPWPYEALPCMVTS